jgi:hypothetical protein
MEKVAKKPVRQRVKTDRSSRNIKPIKLDELPDEEPVRIQLSLARSCYRRLLTMSRDLGFINEHECIRNNVVEKLQKLGY